MERNVIDKMLVNAKMYSYFQDMEIDEKQEAIDVTDHNLLRAKFLKADTMRNFNKHTKWGKIQYYKTDANSLDQLVAKVEEKINTHGVLAKELLNELVVKSINEALKAINTRKVIEGDCKITELI